jgi:hypothetical protein
MPTWSALSLTVSAACVLINAGCDTTELSSSDGSLPVAADPDSSISVAREPPDDSAGIDEILARVDGDPFLASEFEDFLSRARAPGYRPITLPEAQRLLRAGLREKALAVEAARRGYVDHDDSVLADVYRSLVLERTGSPPLGGFMRRGAARRDPARDDAQSREARIDFPSTTDEEPLSQRLTRIQIEHRARIQRRTILEELLARSRVEVDTMRLAAFLEASPQAPRPPLPPGANDTELGIQS